jgi:hypothetical protein
MLNMHPGIAVPPDGFFIANTLRRHARAPWTTARVTAFADDLWRERRLLTWSLDRPRLTAELVEMAGAGGYAAACRHVYVHHAAQLGKTGLRWIGDKNPVNTFFVPDLIRTFPEARFVHIVRDYRDNVVSYKNVRFDANETGALAYRWLHYNRQLVVAAARTPDRFLLTRYEDIVRDPEASMRRLCAFLEMDYTPAMLEYFRERQPTHLPWHVNLGRQLDPSLIGRWHQALSPADVSAAEAICGPLGETIGYQRSRPPGPMPLRAYAGGGLGWLITEVEAGLFRLPLGLRSRVVDVYRRAVGSLVLGTND